MLYQHYACALLHGTVLSLLSDLLSSNHIIIVQAPPPVDVIMSDVAAIIRRQVAVEASCPVVVVVMDGIEAVGMVTIWTPVWSPMFHPPIVIEAIIVSLMRWPLVIGQLVVGIQESLTMSTCNGADGGINTRGRGGGGALREGRRWGGGGRNHRAGRGGGEAGELVVDHHVHGALHLCQHPLLLTLRNPTKSHSCGQTGRQRTFKQSEEMRLLPSVS